MEHKLKAISNNVNNNDTIVKLIPQDQDDKLILNDIRHFCKRQVPVLFVTNRGNQLRLFNKNWPGNYQVTFCDLERWVSVIKYLHPWHIIKHLECIFFLTFDLSEFTIQSIKFCWFDTRTAHVEWLCRQL